MSRVSSLSVSPQQIKAQSPSLECAGPHQTLGRVVSRVFGKLPSGPRTRPRGAVSQLPALALCVWVLGRPGVAHRAQGEPRLLLHPGPYPQAGPPHPASLSAPAPLTQGVLSQLPTTSPWGRSQGTLFLLNAKPKRLSFSRSQEQGDQIRRSRKTRLARLQSSLQARREP